MLRQVQNRLTSRAAPVFRSCIGSQHSYATPSQDGAIQSHSPYSVTLFPLYSLQVWPITGLVPGERFMSTYLCGLLCIFLADKAAACRREASALCSTRAPKRYGWRCAHIN